MHQFGTGTTCKIYRIIRINCSRDVDTGASITKLICRNRRKIDVVGATAFGPDSNPAPSSVSNCPHLASLRKSLEDKCDGRQRCYVTGDELTLNRDQCPGIGAVFIEVTCRLLDEQLGESLDNEVLLRGALNSGVLVHASASGHSER